MNLAMNSAVTSLPDDIDALRALCARQAEELARQSGQLQARDSLIEKLKEQLAALKRARFGKSSEKIERSIAQLELALEEMEAVEAETAPVLSGERGAFHPPDCAWAQKLAVRRIGQGQGPGRRHPVADRDRQAQRPRSGSLSVRCADPHRRSSGQPDR